MEQEGTPLLHVAHGVASIRLRRPSQRNSLHDADLRSLLDCFARIDADPSVRAVVLAADTGGHARPVFCAGYYVGGFDDGQHDPRLFETVADALESLRPVTVCALNGSAYGGATDLVLACDLRIALAGSTMRMPACALGLHYYPNGLRRYVSGLGLNAAKHAFLTGKALAVESLHSLGVFEQVVDAAGFEGAVAQLVQTITDLAPLAAQATKRSLNEIAAHRFDAARLREREALTLDSVDFAEGRAAMRARRKPRFQNR